jgi:hypothetical protein
MSSVTVDPVGWALRGRGWCQRSYDRRDVATRAPPMAREYVSDSDGGVVCQRACTATRCLSLQYPERTKHMVKRPTAIMLWRLGNSTGPWLAGFYV